MNEMEYIKRLEAENEAMRRTLHGKHRKDRDLRPRDAPNHCGYIPLSVRVSNTRVRQGTKDLKDAFFVDFETCYLAETMPITAFNKKIESDLIEIAAKASYCGTVAPRLWELRYSLPRGVERWIVTATFDKQWSVLDLVKEVE